VIKQPIRAELVACLGVALREAGKSSDDSGKGVILLPLPLEKRDCVSSPFKLTVLSEFGKSFGMPGLLHAELRASSQL